MDHFCSAPWPLFPLALTIQTPREKTLSTYLTKIARLGSYVARAQIDGANSKILPARNTVQVGMIFSPWNLAVADSADPAENQWNINAAAHRAYDPVSGQPDFKKLAARIEKIEPA